MALNFQLILSSALYFVSILADDLRAAVLVSERSGVINTEKVFLGYVDCEGNSSFDCKSKLQQVEEKLKVQEEQIKFLTKQLETLQYMNGLLYNKTILLEQKYDRMDANSSYQLMVNTSKKLDSIQETLNYLVSSKLQRHF